MLKNILTMPKPYVSTVTLACLRVYGMEMLDWDPLIIRDTIEQDTGIPKLSQKLFDKIQCGLALIGTNGYTQRPEIFVPSNAVMSGRAITEGSMGLDDPYTLAWGVWEYLNLTASTVEEAEFSEDVRAYTGAVLMQAGITDPPTWLSFADFDETKTAAIEENATDMDFYLNRQTGMKNELSTFVSEKRLELVKQLRLVDQEVPVTGKDR